MACVLVPLAAGCEELEAVTIIDLLRRAGVELVTASLEDGPVTASRSTRLIADTTLACVSTRPFDMIVLPGGLPGADHLAADPQLADMLRRTLASGGYIAAICAAPKVLALLGLLTNVRATAYPGVLEKFADQVFEITNNAVETDGHIITSRGPGTAMDFTLELIRILVGSDVRDSVEAALCRV